MPFKKGCIPWNKGKTGVYSKEVLESMSIVKRGKPSSMKGKTQTATARKKMSDAKQGYVPWNKGKKGVQTSWCKGLTKETSEGLRRSSEKLKGRPLTKECIDNLSKAKKGKPSPKKGIPSGKKGLVKNPELHIRRWFAALPMRVEREALHWWRSYKRRGTNNAFYGRKHSEVTLANLAKTKKGPFNDSKPEKMLQIALALNRIKFTKHKPFKLGNKWHQVDIFIEPNICVEVDGVHWHIPIDRIRRDLYVTQELTVMGYHVIRIRDKDIIQNTQNCAENVIKLIKELHYHVPLGES